VTYLLTPGTKPTRGPSKLYNDTKLQQTEETMIKQLTILAILFVMAVTSCAPRQPETLDTAALIGDRDSITHLRMLDGSTGEMRIFAPGPEITAALDFIVSLEAQRETEQEPRTGYLYWIAGYRDGEEAFRLQFGGEVVNVDGVQYRPGRNLASELDRLYESVPYGGLLEMAMADLAADLGLQADEVFPLSVEAYTFPDTSLGVPEEGMMYAEVLTDGYIMTLSAAGETYTYHGADGYIVRVP
jgi:hypothetical protein